MLMRVKHVAKQICLAIFFAVLAQNYVFAAPAINSWEAIRAAYYPAQEITLTDSEIIIDAPEQAEDSAIVPVTITAKLLHNAVKRVDIFTDANPILLTASFMPQMKSQFFQVATRIRLDNSSYLRVIVEDWDGKKQMRAIPIKTPGGGCGGGVDPDEAKLRAESGKMRLRFMPKENALTLNVKHPMRTGFERTSMGYYARAWFIQNAIWRFNGTPWLKAELGPGISADPYFKLFLDDALMRMEKHGFQIEVSDNEGKIFSQSFEQALETD
jgi:sulfur-oxidizing protein SoxY